MNNSLFRMFRFSILYPKYLQGKDDRVKGMPSTGKEQVEGQEGEEHDRRQRPAQYPVADVLEAQYPIPEHIQ